MIVMTKELSSKISNVSFVCACLVVFIHVSSVKMDLRLSNFIFEWIQTEMTGVAVPLFLIISGLLLGRHINEEGWYRRAIISRVKSLVVPFFMLNLLWFPVICLIHYIGARYFGADGSNDRIHFTFYNFIYGVGLIPWGGGVVVGLWYVRALFYLVLLSPLFAWFIRRGRLLSGVLIIVLLGLWCLQSRIHFASASMVEAMSYTFCMRCPLFFSIGMACALWAPNSLPRNSAIIFVPISAGVLFWTKNHSFTDLSILTLVKFSTTVLLAIAIWSLTPSSKWPKCFIGNSFQVFVLHGMILYLLPIPMKAIGIWDQIINKCGLLPVFVLTVFIAISVAEILKRSFPRFAYVVFGGR